MKTFTLYLLAFILLFSVTAHASIIDNPALYANETPPLVKAEAVVLAETVSGKILYQKNMDKKMYPASLVKVLTALITLEHLEPDELIIAGDEVNAIPYDASRAKHKIGETLLVENLVRGLFVSSGNETACILAIEVARRDSGNVSISYSSAEKYFCELMNAKAKELGAVSSNFVNPHGYHNSKQYTTAYDMLLICDAALKIPLIAKFASETSFDGNGANNAEAALTQDYSWKTTNALISNGEYFYQNATGIRTGQTDESGSCLAASAERDGKKLICISLFTSDPERWTDTVKLFEFGFENFGLQTIQIKGADLGEVKAANTPLEESNVIKIYSNDSFSEFMSKKQFSNIKRLVTFDSKLIYAPGPEDPVYDETMLVPPINSGDIIGKVSYILNDTTIFTGDVIAANSVNLRTFNTDIDFYIDKYKTMFFSMTALPYWIIAFLVIGILVYVVIIVRIKLKQKRKGYKFRK